MDMGDKVMPEDIDCVSVQPIPVTVVIATLVRGNAKLLLLH